MASRLEVLAAFRKALKGRGQKSAPQRPARRNDKQSQTVAADKSPQPAPLTEIAAVALTEEQQAAVAREHAKAKPWRGRVYLNPPYKQPDIDRFCEKFARHAQAGDIKGIVLVNNATDTRWFATLASVATAFCFPGFRCRYWQPDRDTSTALQGQAIVYAGPDHAAFCERFAPLGLVLVRP